MAEAKPLLVRKTTGEHEPFDLDKVRTSVLRAGATPAVAREVTEALTKRLKPQTVTSEAIYQHSFAHLKRTQPQVAARYSLKRALMQLGPAGYVFERFIARLLQSYGYRTDVGTIIRGYCVEHEVDVSARRGRNHFLVECKYHNRPGIKTDVKVALYVQSRFEDIVRASRELRGHGDEFHQAWLVTNTQCTTQAIRYARCRGMRILAWRYPRDRGLEYYIETRGLYPVTVLPSLTPEAARRLSMANVILARELAEHSADALGRRFNLKRGLVERLLREAAPLVR